MPARPVLQLPPTGPPVRDCTNRAARGASPGAVPRCGRQAAPSPCAQQVPPNNLDRVNCYVCGRAGHLCCAPQGEAAACDGADQGGPTQLLPMRRRRSRDAGIGRAEGRAASERQRTPGFACFKCGGQGHIARECPVGGERGADKGAEGGGWGRYGRPRAGRGRPPWNNGSGGGGAGRRAVGRVRRRRARGWGMEGRGRGGREPRQHGGRGGADEGWGEGDPGVGAPDGRASDE